MRYGMLGPLVTPFDRNLRAGQFARLIGSLVLEANRFVPAGRLAKQTFGADHGADKQALQVQISRLRRARDRG